MLDSVVPSWNVDPLQLAGLRETATVLRAACAAQRCDFDPASDLAVVVRRYHDGPAVLDTLVEMSVSDPSFPGVPAALHAAAAGRPASLNGLIAQVHASDAATSGELSQGLHAEHAVRGYTDAVGRPGHPARGAARRAGPGRGPADHGSGLALRPGHRSGQRPHPDLPVLAARSRPARRHRLPRQPAAGPGPAAGRRS